MSRRLVPRQQSASSDTARISALRSALQAIEQAPGGGPGKRIAHQALSRDDAAAAITEQLVTTK